MTPPMSTDPAAQPAPGEVIDLLPGVRRILAPNPSPMTYWGTNTYIIGTGRDLAVIDPGPDLDAHHAAILATCAPGQRITHIIVTHSHLDHSPLARPLSAATGAPVLAFGGPTAGRSPVMQALAANGLAGGGEGLDHDFTCDQTLSDGDRVTGADWQLRAIHTPGHIGNHICLALGDVLFCGDHIMGWASSLVSPPDGDLTDFMASCTKLRAESWQVMLPAHGAPIWNPAGRLDWLMAHRRSREASVLETLQAAPHTVPTLTAAIYHDTPPALLPAAERNVFAHLVDLVGRNLVTAKPALSLIADFAARKPQ